MKLRTSGFIVACAALVSLSSAAFASANLLANGSFETAGAPANGGAPSGAKGWVQIAGGGTELYVNPDLSTGLAQDGTADIHLVNAGPGNAGILQNSVNDGGMPSITPPTGALTLTFWVKGTFGDTGNLSYAMRYLDPIGNIVTDSGTQTISSGIVAGQWTKFTLVGAPLTSPANAVFVEFNAAAGPEISGNAEDLYIDNVSVTAVPEPASLSAIGLAGAGLLLRRRRSA